LKLNRSLLGTHLHYIESSSTLIEMPKPPAIFCGFADIQLFYYVNTAQELRDYDQDMGLLYPRMRMDYNTWSKRHKINNATLKDR